jgi:predicted NBD/HSP70 family sugar kinase
VVTSAGDHPSRTVRVDRGVCHVVGVDVGESAVRAGVFDLTVCAPTAANAPLAAANAPLGADATPSQVVRAVTTIIAQVTAEAGVREDEILGVGVGLPGMVTQGSDSLVHAPTIGWHAVPLAALLRQRIDVPFLVENNATALGRAEMRFGAGREVRNAVVAFFGIGVGACIISDGVIQRGATSSAGEFGHSVIVMDGQPCRCGGAGCLEAYVGAAALAARHAAARHRPVPADDELVSAVQDLLVTDGIRAGRCVVAEAVDYTGLALANLINVLDPGLIVLGGWVGLLLGTHHREELEQAVARYALPGPLAHTRITVSELGPDAVALGAETLPIDLLPADGTAFCSARAGAGRR